jgi:hypothetical protein
MLSVLLFIVMVNVGMLNVVMLNVVMLNVVMWNVVMLDVVMLNVFMLSVVAPKDFILPWVEHHFDGILPVAVALAAVRSVINVTKLFSLL